MANDTICCWKRRTTLEKSLIFALSTFFVVVVATFVIVTLYVRTENDRQHLGISTKQNPPSTFKFPWLESNSRHKSNNGTLDPTASKPICSSSNCVRVAHRMLSFIDERENPCENFHRFACGGWQKANAIHGEQLLRSIFAGEMVQRVDETLQHLLESDEPLGHLPAFETVRLFYKSCISEKAIRTRGIEPVHKLMDSIGRFYEDNNTTEVTTRDLTLVLAKLLLMNGDSLFDVGVDVDTRNSSKLIIVLTLPSQSSVISEHKNGKDKQSKVHLASNLLENLTGIDRNNLTENHQEFFQLLLNSGIKIDSALIYTSMKLSADQKTDDKMWNLLRKYLNRTKEDPTQINLEQEIKHFLLDLREILPLPKKLKEAEGKGEFDRIYSIRELQHLLPNIDWKFLFQELLPEVDLKEDRNEILVIYPSYFKKLNELFEKHSLRVINNAAIAIFARNVLWELINVETDIPRFTFCVEATKTVFPDILSAMYIRSFPRQLLVHIRNDVNVMFLNLKESFLKYLDKLDWLDGHSKDRAKLKVEQMKGHFIGAETSYNDTLIEAMAENITVSVQTFFENVILNYVRGRRWFYEAYSKQMARKTFESNILTHPFVVNAYYMHMFNKISITLGILFPPYYAPGEPKYVTYGSIGTTIGHEIMHGFDSKGLKYDMNGSVNQWIHEDSLKRFKDKLSCFQHFYQDNFNQKVPFLDKEVTIHFDGNFTLNENLADNVGLTIAFQAYNNWKLIHGDESVLPGLHMTQEQLFFLSAAQASCAMLSPYGYVFALELDEHTPEPERVNGFLMNSDSFAKAFQCPLGSPMNPYLKCKL